MLGGGGTGTYARKKIGRLYGNGSLDTDFNPGVNSIPETVVVQPDGKVLVGGTFTLIGGGGSGSTARNNIARLNPDGSVDALFDPNASGMVRAIALQPDGKILVGGSFTQIGGAARSRIARLNANGTLDPGFDPGANGVISGFAVQPDGKIVVVGYFTTLGGGGTGTTTRNYIGRLNADGSLDSGFNPGANANTLTVALESDGQILVGGYFTALGGGGTGTTTRNRIGRLNSGGSLDTGFNPGANNSVWSIAVQEDGQILVVGLFTKLGGGTGTINRNFIGRLTATGSVDAFNPGANNALQAFALQADGKIVVGGSFSGLGGGSGTTVRNRIGRLNSDGSVDTTFNPGANGTVEGLAIQQDGKIVVCGYFTTLGGGGTGTLARNYIGRLSTATGAIEDLQVAEDSVTWLRGGTGPAPTRVTFESSPDGVTYTPLGEGDRISGGWQLAGLSLPTRQNLFVRARGTYSSGLCNGSSSAIESVRNAWLAEDSLPPAGDFTGDMKSDILWHHATRGEVWLWPMDGAGRRRRRRTWARWASPAGRSGGSATRRGTGRRTCCGGTRRRGSSTCGR